MTARGGRRRHAVLLAVAVLYSVFPIYFVTVQSLKTPQEDVFGSPLYVTHPTFENYTELFEEGAMPPAIPSAHHAGLSTGWSNQRKRAINPTTSSGTSDSDHAAASAN